MTIEASYVARPTISPQAAFSWGLIAATILPFVSIAASNNFGGAAVVALALFVIASGHVVATGYLLADQDVRRFLSANPIKMILVPIALMVGGLLLFSQATGIVLALAFALLALYQAWHFGAQNIGVASFISLSDRGRPLRPREKIVIRCGIIAGVFGVLQAMSSGASSVWFSPLGNVGTEAFHFAYELGAAMSIPLAGVALWMMFEAFRDQHYRFGIAIALSVCFLFPMYVSQNYLLGFVSFAVAHGVQYLIFLFVHAGSEKRSETERRVTKLAMPALLIALIIAGACIWNTPVFERIPNIGIAIVPALTLGHFWIDLFLWRMKDPARAAWIRARFGAVIRPAA